MIKKEDWTTSMYVVHGIGVLFAIIGAIVALALPPTTPYIMRVGAIVFGALFLVSLVVGDLIG